MHLHFEKVFLWSMGGPANSENPGEHCWKTVLGNKIDKSRSFLCGLEMNKMKLYKTVSGKELLEESI